MRTSDPVPSGPGPAPQDEKVHAGPAPQAQPRVVRVLYIGGWGRSGSTLLERLVGQVEGFAAVGEMREIWERGFLENRLCGCGVPFRSCPFWSDVVERAFGGADRAPARELLALRRSVDRPWVTPLLFRRHVPSSLEAGIQRYTQALGRLYRAIQEVSGCAWIVDSSKLPSHALLLRRAGGIDLRVIHLVRDSRGVAYSWQKQVRRTDGAGAGPDFMRRYGPVGAAARYVLYNTLTGRLPAAGIPTTRMRYEDLTIDPAKQLGRVLDATVGRSAPAALRFLRGDEAELRVNHTVDGNPVRFATGPLEIRADEEWRRSIGTIDHAVVSTLTSPLLVRYGYGVRR